MAEVFGIVAGAAGIAALFTPCIECFEYIQFGRRFGKDYGSCLLKLDVVRLRLTRWGLSVGILQDSIHHQNVIKIAASAEEANLAEVLLSQIFDAFEEARVTSEMFRSLKYLMLASVSNQGSNSSTQRLEPLPNEGKATNFLRKSNFSAWALYEKKRFDQLIEEVTGFMDSLEDLFPAARELQVASCAVEVSEINDPASLALLEDISSTSDRLLAKGIAKNLADRGSTYRNFEISGEETSRTRIGNNYAPGEGREPPKYSLEGFKISGKGYTHIGHNYGYPNGSTGSHSGS